MSVDPNKKAHFGFGAKRYMVDEVECEVQYVTLPDNRIVCLRDWSSQFSAYGQVWDMSIPAQPKRVDLFNGEFGAEFPVYEAIENLTGKDFLVQRFQFPYKENVYKVGPEAYGEAAVQLKNCLKYRSVAVRLPIPEGDTFLSLYWSVSACGLEVIGYENLNDGFLYDEAGKLVVDKDDKPVYRPYVWAASALRPRRCCPMDTIEFDYEGSTYRVGSEAYADDLAIHLPDGQLIKPEYWYECKLPIPMHLMPIREGARCAKATLVI